MKAVVTGALGFIGSHLASHLASKDWDIVGIDLAPLNGAKRNWRFPQNFTYFRANLSQAGDWEEKIRGADLVYHFAADPDVRTSSENPHSHFSNNVTATWNVIESMRKTDVDRIVFASSSTVLGEPRTIPTPESYPNPSPISVYGATKLACENLILGHVNSYDLKGLVLRPANVIGPHLTHGVILDFIRKLREDPLELEVLGDGRQRKSYIHIVDFLRAIDSVVREFTSKQSNFDIYNIGNTDATSVVEIAKIVSRAMGLSPKLNFVQRFDEGRAWIGDVRTVLLDIGKLRSLSWTPDLSSDQAVERSTGEALQEL